ncbi:MAG: tRNA (adenosine(37)-N6)-threonylcarbamoyltransferase complex dimerization subunit type 1 TsaB [Paludibacteraceae bacterium]|nr:tRNA (adenosine(37)-N6)-threonylcarbamoyltransferase complex dimerization subunit type 1 TsaB [Paludibacteraceae bacterium]
MANIVCIETSGAECSVAVATDGQCVWQKKSDIPQNHACLLSPFLDEALDFLRKANQKLDAVAVSSGPGSYTGLRIGVSTAKGLCLALNIPLLAIPTLQLMAHQAKSNPAFTPTTSDALLCPMIDARRMEVYTALYSSVTFQIVKEPWAEVVTETSFQDYLSERDIYFLGSGAAKCRSVFTSPHAFFLDDDNAHAVAMAELAQQLYDGGKTVDVAYFEPFYLKDFYATTPKHKVI